ncbi:MAG TPA: competence type IV pilus major pilin ComGC [Sporosarcina sp.]|nr:competence type IV pilus major pilin ComGC [Sporosarcina sp.]
MKIVKKEEGFTLIEMMIVLLIISVLILIAIPNVTKHSKSIDEKGCAAFVKMAQGQVEAYKMEHHKSPTSIQQLIDTKYLPEEAKCPDGRVLAIKDGEVSATANEED